MKLLKNIHLDPTLTPSFYAITKEHFGFDFSEWIQNGYWDENFTSYAMVEGEEVVSYLTASRLMLCDNGKAVNLLQLGTVCTRKAYRRRGYSRVLIEAALADAKDLDGAFLYANDTVVDFYPRFGFRKAEESDYKLFVSSCGEKRVKETDLSDPETLKRVKKAVYEAASYTPFGAKLPNLAMFYLPMETVYEDPKTGAFFVAEAEGDTLHLSAVYAKTTLSLKEAAEAFGREITVIHPQYLPFETPDEQTTLVEEDTSFFVQGPYFDTWSSEKRLPIFNRT